MIVSYSKQQMLAAWMLRRGLTPVRTDCVVSRGDGVDIASLMQLEIDCWYARLLASGPLAMVEVSDIAPSVALRVDSDGSALIDLPDTCRRVVGVRLHGWRRDALPVTAASDRCILDMQSSEFVRGGAWLPVAVIEGRRLRLYSPVAGSPGIASLRCVMQPADGSYRFDDTALSTIPDMLSSQ